MFFMLIAGMMVGSVIGYTLCAMFFIGSMSEKEENLKGDSDERVCND
jgi:hypothetical protein